MEVVAALSLKVSLSDVTAGAGGTASSPAARNTRQHSVHAGPSGPMGNAASSSPTFSAKTNRRRKESKEEETANALRSAHLPPSHVPKYEMWFYIHRDSARRSHRDIAGLRVPRRRRTLAPALGCFAPPSAEMWFHQVDPCLPHRQDDRRSRRLSLISTERFLCGLLRVFGCFIYL